MTYKDLTAAVKVTVTEKPYELFAFEEDSYEVEYEQTLRVKMSLDERIDLEKMVYESSNPEIAKFEYGRITGMSEGEATITIKYPDKNLSKSVKVVVKLSALELGRKEKAEEFNKKVNAIQAITIDNIEEVEALILEYDGYNESILRYVTVGEKVEKMKNESKVLVIINQIDKLPEVVTPEDSKQIALARVTYENAPSEIKAQITNLARLEAKEVELEQAIFDAIPESIRLEVNAGDLLKVNGSIELNVSTVKPATVEKLVWTSSDESIATVAAGKVTGKKAGIAKITASNAGKEESSIYVTVYNASDISDEALAFVAAAHNANIFVKKAVPIGAGTPEYFKTMIGSVSKLLFNSQLEIQEMMTAKGSGNRPETIKTSTEFITVHYTGNMRSGADAKANAGYFTAPTTTSSIHYVTGNDGVYHCIPDNEVAYHAGDGTSTTFEWFDTGVVAKDNKTPRITTSSDGYFVFNGEKTVIAIPEGKYTVSSLNNYDDYLTLLGPAWKVGTDGKYYIGTTWFCTSQVSSGMICSKGGNNNSIGIESCVNEGSDIWFTWQRTAQLVAKLMVENNLDINSVKPHNFYTAKDCPQPMLEYEGLMWYEFIKLVEFEYLKITKFADYTFTLTSIDYENAENTGRISKRLAETTTITYTVLVENANTGYSKSITLSSQLIGSKAN